MDTTCSRCAFRTEERRWWGKWVNSRRLRCCLTGEFVDPAGICKAKAADLFDAKRMAELLISEKVKPR